MSFEPQIASVELKNKRCLEKQNTQVILSFQTNGQKIEKVLYAKSEICVGEVTTNNQTATVVGNVETHVFVKTQEGIIPLVSSAPFSVSFNSNLISPDSKVWAEVHNQGTDNVTVNEISLSLTQKISVRAFVLEKQTQNYVSSIAPANQKLEMYDLNTIANVLSENFETNLELEFPNSCSKLLGAESFAVANNVQTSKDMVTVSGTIYTNLFYLSADEIPKFKSKLYANDFVQEFLLSGTEENQKAFAQIFVCKTNVEVDGDENKEKGLIALTIKERANILVQTTFQFEAVTDAFCPKKELQLDFSSFTTQNVVFSKVFGDKIDTTYVLQDQEQRVDKIVLVAPNYVELTKIQVAGSDVTLKGKASVQLLFLLDDEEHTLKSEQITFPFEVLARCDENLKDSKIFARVHLKEVEARLKKSKEIDVNGDILVEFFVVQEQTQAIVSNVVVGEDRKQNQPNMGIYVVSSAKDLWEVSKKLLVNPQILEEQNPELTFPITKPTQIIVYRQKII